MCYPLAGFKGEKRAEQILQFRDTLQEAIQEHAGDDAVTFLGGATGLYYGYLDFIAWDLPAVLDAAKEFFAGTELTLSLIHISLTSNESQTPKSSAKPIDPCSML